MSTTDDDIYRLVPFRFLADEADSDICKLEKLTNLFPDMKEIIELELFKVNNLTRLVNRLSKVFTVLTAIDNHNDALHLFLGPYHLSLGPAVYGAFHFKNVSAALLASSHSKTSSGNTHQHYKRRHEAVLRRFRRAVRKLIHIKSIIDQLRLASILTPYNQYELYTHGIYDLVLAGHMHKSNSVFNDDDFTGQINDFRSMFKSENEHSLLATKFVKINTLLRLISPTPPQSENNSLPGKIPQNRPKDSSTYSTNDNSSKSLRNSTTRCCSQHDQNMSLFKLATNRSISHQPTHLLPSESRTLRYRKPNVRRTSSAPRNKIFRNSLPDLSIADSSGTNIPSNSTTLKSNDLAIVQPHASSSQLNTKQDDVFVNYISSLLTSYLLTQQPTVNHNNHNKMNDSTDSLSSPFSRTESVDGDTFNQFSSIIENEEFDKLIQRIKTVVDNNLSDHQNSSHSSMKTITTADDLREESLMSHGISYQEIPTDEFHVQNLKSSINQRKLYLSSKSQSFDDTNLSKGFSSVKPGINDNSVEF